MDDGDEPDPELRRLVSRILDEKLTEEEKVILEKRLRDEPAAERYCAEAIRFEATLQEAISPRSLEWEETRRVVFDAGRGVPSWSIQRQQTLRYGDSPGRQGPFGKRSKWPWLAGIAVLAGCVAALFFVSRPDANLSFTLRNGDFEAMDLTQSPTGIDRSVLNWQDYFSTPGTEVFEIGRVSKGRIYAKSGRNVVRLKDHAFLNQRILDKAGTQLQAEPGLRVAVSGWYYLEGTTSIPLRGSLRFVASGYPDMIQYEAANATVQVDGSGWKAFKIEFVLPVNLQRSPSDTSSRTRDTPPAIDLAGKPLTLSLDNRSTKGELFLDDLNVEVDVPES